VVLDGARPFEGGIQHDIQIGIAKGGVDIEPAAVDILDGTAIDQDLGAPYPEIAGGTCSRLHGGGVDGLNLFQGYTAHRLGDFNQTQGLVGENIPGPAILAAIEGDRLVVRCGEDASGWRRIDPERFHAAMDHSFGPGSLC